MSHPCRVDGPSVLGIPVQSKAIKGSGAGSAKTANILYIRENWMPREDSNLDRRNQNP